MMRFLQDFWISAIGGGEIHPASRNPEILGEKLSSLISFLVHSIISLSVVVAWGVLRVTK